MRRLTSRLLCRGRPPARAQASGTALPEVSLPDCLPGDVEGSADLSERGSRVDRRVDEPVALDLEALTTLLGSSECLQEVGRGRGRLRLGLDRLGCHGGSLHRQR